jgi:hypothetical protein
MSPSATCKRLFGSFHAKRGAAPSSLKPLLAKNPNPRTNKAAFPRTERANRVSLKLIAANHIICHEKSGINLNFFLNFTVLIQHHAEAVLWEIKFYTERN